MQKKTTTMTSAGGNLKTAESDSSLADTKADFKIKSEKSSNCNTLPSQSSNKGGDSKANGGAKTVKFSTLPSQNKGVFNNHV